MFKMAILGSQAQRLPRVNLVLGSQALHLPRFNLYDGRTEFSSAAPAALQLLNWPYRVLKRCACRASTFKMAVRGSQVLRPSRKQMESVNNRTNKEPN